MHVIRSAEKNKLYVTFRYAHDQEFRKKLKAYRKLMYQSDEAYRDKDKAYITSEVWKKNRNWTLLLGMRLIKNTDKKGNCTLLLSMHVTKPTDRRK